MKISALVTTYRRFGKCCRAIDSILAQTRPVEEIIVIDNGSPEPEYLGLQDRYALSPVPVNVVRLSRGTHTQPPLLNDHGREISTASRDTLNLAMTLARGDWFAPCHDDDEWMPQRIERQVDFQFRTRRFGLIGCNVYNRTEAGEVLGVHHDYYGTHGTPIEGGATDVTDCIPAFNPLAVSGLLFSRRLLRMVGPWQAWVDDLTGDQMRSLSASDWDFYRRATAATRIARLDEPLVYYEVHNVKHEGHQVHAAAT